MDYSLVKVKVNGTVVELQYGREIWYDQAVRLARLTTKDGTIPKDFRVRFRYKTGRYGMLFCGGPPITAAQALVITVGES